jgi:hypothetical protein
MPLRFGIPLTLAVLIGVSAVSFLTGVNLYYPIVGITAVGIAFDAWRLDVQRYQTRLALHPVVLALLTGLFFALVAPWYLRTRYRVLRGEIQVGAYPKGSRVALAIGAACLVAVVAISQYSLRDIRPLVASMSAEFDVPFSLSLNNGRYLYLTVPSDALPEDTDREAYALRMANFANRQHTGKKALIAVTVRFMTTTDRGSVRTTKVDAEYRWFGGELERHPAR